MASFQTTNEVKIELWRTEGELVRIERLKALGELAAGVSHNNMLTGILGPAERLKLDNTDPELLTNIQDIVTSATRARNINHRLVYF